ncbi:TPA: hypothetical protein ACSP8B_004104 [Aeromonas veronii]
MNNPIQPVGSSGSLVSQDFSKFDIYLEQLGLPKDNILASNQERQMISQLFPTLVVSLPDELKRESRYLSKFAAASAIGLFDAALNYVWNEVVLNLREKAISYGLDLFYDAAVGGKLRDLYKTTDDLSSIKDKVLLDTCSKLELISDIIYKKLCHILIMRNDIGASHPNDSSVRALELMSWLQICVQDVIADRPSEAALQVKAFIENLRSKSEVIEDADLKIMQSGLKDLHTKNIDNLLQTIFGMYVGADGNNILKKNISNVAPAIWTHASDNAKFKLGLYLEGYQKNLHNDKFVSGSEFFEFCKGNAFKTLESRTILLDGYLDDLLLAHHGWDNFIHEVPHARNIISYIESETDIPDARRDKFIKIIMECRVGNGVSYCSGVSPQGKVVYDNLLKKLGDNNIVLCLISFYSVSIKSLLDNANCHKNSLEIINLLRKNIVSEKLGQIFDHLIVNAGSIGLEKTLNSTEFKKLASSHITFS